MGFLYIEASVIIFGTLPFEIATSRSLMNIQKMFNFA